MVVNTKYEIGEEVFVKTYRGTEPMYVKGEIIHLSVHKGKHIRYHIIYQFSGDTLATDRWEDDLIEEDLTGSAMPRIIQVRIPQTRRADDEPCN